MQYLSYTRAILLKKLINNYWFICNDKTKEGQFVFSGHIDKVIIHSLFYWLQCMYIHTNDEVYGHIRVISFKYQAFTMYIWVVIYFKGVDDKPL